MKKVFIVLGMVSLLMFTVVNSSFSANSDRSRVKAMVDANDIIGRWDITIDEDGKRTPSWLEVKLSGTHTLVGYFVSTTGSTRPVSKINFDDGKFSFAIPPQWEGGSQDFVIEGELVGTEIRGTIVTSNGRKYNWKGVKAPYLTRATAPVWAKPIELFNGKDLTGWKALGNNQWEVINGVLTSSKSGSNLISDRQFTDFKLHVEFRYQKGSNSGVYLRGRYEVQIEDSPKEAHPSNILFGGVYGFLSPSEIAALGPDQWQTFDITLVGRKVTIVANGKTIISNQEIPGITGGAIDSNEGEPGPIYIQGDHGPIEFRKIVITPVQ